MAETCREECALFQLSQSYIRYLGSLSQLQLGRYLNLLDVIEQVESGELEPISEDDFEATRMRAKLAGSGMSDRQESIAHVIDVVKEELGLIEKGCVGGALKESERGLSYYCRGFSIITARKMLAAHAELERGMPEGYHF